MVSLQTSNARGQFENKLSAFRSCAKGVAYWHVAVTATAVVAAAVVVTRAVAAVMILGCRTIYQDVTVALPTYLPPNRE
jgi:hypothetical protein